MPEWKPEILRRLAPLKLSPTREAEIAEELAQHLDDRYQELVASGQSEDAAFRTALDELRGEDLLARSLRPLERSFDREPIVPGKASTNFFQGILQDIRYALRMLRKSPGFSAIVILTLALGIGANATIFSVIDAVLLRPLPYPQPDGLMYLEESNPKHGWPRFSASPANFLDWRSRSRSFEHVVAYAQDDCNVSVGDFPEHWIGLAVTQGFFDTLRVRPELGSVFTDDDFVPGKGNVFVMSDALWRSEFGADPSVIGRTVPMDGKPFTVIGVMPPGFQFNSPNKMYWLPFIFSKNLSEARGAHFLGVIARLRDVISIAQAQGEMKTLAANLEREYPDSNEGWTVVVEPIQARDVHSVHTALLVLFGAVGFVLLIACANAANMLLARATVRRREIAIRTALGAGRLRIARQLLTESVLLALSGAAIGLLFTMWCVRALAALPPSLLPRAEYIHIDIRVLLFTFGLALVTGILFGMAPAASIIHEDLADTLKEAGRVGASGRGVLRNILVVVEVALAFVLLVGSGLLVRSFARLMAVQPGFSAASRLTFSVQLPSSRYKTPQQQMAFFQEAKQRLVALPGVKAVTMTSLVPLSGEESLWTFGLDGQQNGTSLPAAMYYRVDSDYLKAMGIPLIEGRGFSSQDSAIAPHVCIINDFVARTMFPGRSPIGQHVRIGNEYGTVREIVGVIGSVKQVGLEDKESYQVYEPFAQWPQSGMTFIVQTSVDPMSLLAAARRSIQQIDPLQPIARPRTLEQVSSESVALPRLRTILLALFGALATVLALVGLYGVMSYTVTQQKHEIGVRKALGAQQRDIYRLVVLRGLGLAGIGVGVGIAGAAAVTRLLSSFLFGVTPYDPVTLLSVIVLFGAVAVVACWLPARRATRVDPMVALRYE
jgi:putative ABC transport system permease protein